MRDSTRGALAVWMLCVIGMVLLLLTSATPAAGQAGKDTGAPARVCQPARMGSPYIPVDSWVYPAMLRLYSLGYVDKVFLNLRPWTRASIMHMLEDAGSLLEDSEADGDPAAGEAREIYDALNYELHYDMEGPCGQFEGNTRTESVYTVARAISGTPLHDSFHLGSTIVNDYGRPFESGFNNYSGVSGYASAGRFTLYARGEFQGAPSAAGYSASLGQALSAVDMTSYYETSSTAPYGPTTTPYNQTTIPQGPIATATNGRFLEAYLSYQYLNHVFSIGKQDQWLGPAQGASMAFSNNAQNFYSFEINRIEPLNIPWLSRLTGPFRYEFLVGALRGHTFMPNPEYEANPSPNLINVTNPGDPWVHVEKISFRPTKNLEFGFERTVLWGGKATRPSILTAFFTASSAPTLRQLRSSLARTTPERGSGLSTFPTGCPSCANGSRSILTPKCTTMSRPPTLRGGLPTGREFICRMCLAFPSSTCAWRRPRLIPPHPRCRAGNTVISCTGNRSSGRAIRIRASFLATGSDAKTRAAKPGLPII